MKWSESIRSTPEPARGRNKAVMQQNSTAPVQVNINLNDKKEVFARIALPHNLFTVFKLHWLQGVGNRVKFPRG